MSATEEPVIYSLMETKDIDAILKLQEECGLSPWSREGYQETLKSEETDVYIAKCRENVVGFLVWRLITSENLCEILNICVASNQRRKHIGEGLVTQIFKRFDPKIYKFWLEVREGNHGAIAFYKKHGFETVGLRKNFYREPAENALLMQRDLD